MGEVSQKRENRDSNEKRDQKVKRIRKKQDQFWRTIQKISID